MSPPAVARRMEPHPAQAAFLSSSADIAIFGGGAGGGKTHALLMEPLRHIHSRRFGCVIFRRELTRITNVGGMWEEAANLYLPLAASRRQSPRMEFRFPSGAQIQFGHLEYEQTKHAWSGAQVGLMEFDQLEEFTEGQFWFLLSRNRTSRGVRPYVRATANPVPPEDPVGGWLAKLIQWWWDPETGYPIPERSGVVRWFVRIDEEIRWADSREAAVGIALAFDVPRAEAEEMPKSLTFIPATVDDNPSIGRDYVANLAALTLVERERLRWGNWKIRPRAGLVFDRANFEVVEAVPAGTIAVRAWDKAASPGKGDFSVGLRLDYAPDGFYYVTDVTRGQWSYSKRNEVMLQKADADGKDVDIELEQEPGSGGKESAEESIRQLAGWVVHASPSTGSKLDRARPVAAQSQVGNIRVLKAEWTDGFLQRVHNFTGQSGGKDDDVDAFSLGFNKLAAKVAASAILVGRAGPRPDRPSIDERLKQRMERRAEIMRTRGGMVGRMR